MELDGVEGDEEGIRDFGVGLALGEKVEHLLLPVGEGNMLCLHGINARRGPLLAPPARLWSFMAGLRDKKCIVHGAQCMVPAPPGDSGHQETGIA